MLLNRLDVLKKLEGAYIAVTSNALLEQSNMFVFTEGELVTFNGEVCTRQESPFLSEITGAIVASNMIKILQRLPDDELEFRSKGVELVIKGKKRASGIKMMEEVRLPHQEVPRPKSESFVKIPNEFREYLLSASRVCGRDETAPKTTHVHIAKDRVESTDSFRIFRANVNTGMKKSVLIHYSNLIGACKFILKRMANTEDGWFHFRTKEKMTISILCSADTFYEKQMLDDLLNVEGKPIQFPSNLSDILSRAQVMESSNLDGSSQVQITLENGKFKIRSEKEDGWFQEVKKVQYTGPKMTFTIHPLFLKELVSQTPKALISSRQIRVESENIQFTAALEVDDSSNEEDIPF